MSGARRSVGRRRRPALLITGATRAGCGMTESRGISAIRFDSVGLPVPSIKIKVPPFTLASRCLLTPVFIRCSSATSPRRGYFSCGRQGAPEERGRCDFLFVLCVTVLFLLSLSSLSSSVLCFVALVSDFGGSPFRPRLGGGRSILVEDWPRWTLQARENRRLGARGPSCIAELVWLVPSASAMYLRSRRAVYGFCWGSASSAGRLALASYEDCTPLSACVQAAACLGLGARMSRLASVFVLQSAVSGGAQGASRESWTPASTPRSRRWC
ncbi:hypothetical protein C8F04DRAFT_238408 [Mycena alexandri]|uniref:Transmembrane protein n=1 Tax=Mycena alexandri TaxID=1745969 RepID=A0AAD6XCS9_9AGAR|nr:hypothetical protein C8F04DRAFT_238408 [Mycena alexandri]